MGNLVSLMTSAYDSPTLRGPSFIRVGLVDPLRDESSSRAGLMTLSGPRVELIGSSQYEFVLYADSPTLRGPS